MSTTFQIVREGRVYIFSRRELKFEVTIEKAHKVLQGQSKSSTFDALYSRIAEKWLIRDDVVKPFGVRLENIRFVCTFDLDQDILVYSDVRGHIQLPLARLREPSSDPPQRSDFASLEIPSPPELDLAKFPPPYHTPRTPMHTRNLALSPRILSDFADQWRHILRATYAESTFLRIANAIISIASNDFRIDEVSTKQQISFRSSYVTPVDVPYWEPCKSHLFTVGDTTVVLHQDLETALKIAKEEAKDSHQFTHHAEPRTFLLLSVRYMMVGYVDDNGKFLYTAPTLLMDGLSPCSPGAIYLLLQALSPSRPPPRSPLHNLPLEIQDQILQHVSKAPIEAARLGCVLGLGSPCMWTRAVDWPRRGGPIELFVSPSHRLDGAPVESKVCFGDVFSGISYR